MVYSLYIKSMAHASHIDLTVLARESTIRSQSLTISRRVGAGGVSGRFHC